MRLLLRIGTPGCGSFWRRCLLATACYRCPLGKDVPRLCWEAGKQGVYAWHDRRHPAELIRDRTFQAVMTEE
jgi:hypothetical protein